MVPTQDFRTFVELVGSRREAARAIDVSLALIDHILAGRRAVTKRVAERVEVASEGRIRKENLLWGNEAA